MACYTFLTTAFIAIGIMCHHGLSRTTEVQTPYMASDNRVITVIQSSCE